MTEEGQFVTAILGALRHRGIDCLVLRNHEGIPDTVGNDLDLLVSPGHRALAEGAIVAAAGRIGWRLVNRAEFVPTALYFSRSGGAGLHVDLFHGLWWRGFEIVTARRLLQTSLWVDPHSIPAPVLENVLILLSGLLYSGTVRDKYRARLVWTAQSDRRRFEDELAATCGAGLAARLVAAVGADDWPAVDALAGRARRTIVLRSLSHPFVAGRRLGREATRIVRRFLRPPGLMVLLLGTDGSGKTSVARGLSSRLDWLFPVERGRLIHWRPTIAAPEEGPGVPVTDPHGTPPRSVASSSVYLSYHWLRFVIGSWLGLQPVLFRNGLVICDRYYQDFYVDKRRYRLDVPDWLLRSLDRGFRQPDLTLVLDLDPGTAMLRKQEVTLDELRRQREGYRRLGKRMQAGDVVDASQPLDDVVDDAVRIIESYLTRRAGPNEISG